MELPASFFGLKIPSQFHGHWPLLHIQTINLIFIQSLPENKRGGNTSQVIWLGQNYPDTKTRQNSKKKKKENYKPIPLMNQMQTSSTKYW